MFEPRRGADQRLAASTPGVGAEQILRSVRRFRWSIGIFVLLGIGGGLLLSALTPPVYQVNTTYFAAAQNTDEGTALDKDEYVQRRINSYVGVVNSERVADLVIQDTGLDVSRKSVMRDVTASVDPDTVLLQVAVQDSSSDRAERIAGSLSRNLNEAISQLETSGGDPEIRLSVISGPTRAGAPISPRPKLNAVIGLLLGLAVGLGQAILRGQLDRSYRDRDDLTADTDLPILAVVPYDRQAKKLPVLGGHRLDTQRAEAFRHLRTSLRFIDATRTAKVITVCSSVDGEGRSTTAVNLALTMAAAGQKVLLADADLRQGRLASYLELSQSPGLTELLADDKLKMADLVQSSSHPELEVLTSGTPAPNPSELLGSPAMRRVLEQASSDYDMVVLDSPALLPVTDAAVLATQTDGVIMVVRYGKTKRDRVQHCIDGLRTVDAHILGTVLTMSRDSDVRGTTPQSLPQTTKV